MALEITVFLSTSSHKTVNSLQLDVLKFDRSLTCAAVFRRLSRVVRLFVVVLLVLLLVVIGVRLRAFGPGLLQLSLPPPLLLFILALKAKKVVCEL